MQTQTQVFVEVSFHVLEHEISSADLKCDIDFLIRYVFNRHTVYIFLRALNVFGRAFYVTHVIRILISTSES